MAMAMGAGLLCFPAGVTAWLRQNHDTIMNRSYKDKFEYMYVGIHNHRSRWSKYYWPISLFRRILFVVIAVVLHDYPCIELMCLVFFSSIYIISYAAIRPHWDNRRTRLEIFNEVMIMYFEYHTMIFTDYCTNPSFQFLMGYSYCAFLGLVVVVNVVNMLLNTVEKSKRKNKLDRLRAA